MAIDQALIAQVHKDALSLPASEVKPPEGAVGAIIEDYQNFAALLLKDRPDFVAANRGVANIDVAQAVLHVLLHARSEVVVTREDVSDLTKKWNDEKPLLLKNRSKLLAAANDLTYDHPELTSVVREIEEGSSNLDSINDVFSGTKIGRKYLDHFAAITLDGETLDAAFLDKADAHATECLELLNQIDVITDKSKDIDFRNRVFIIAQRVKNQAWRDMKLVFWNKKERVEAYYRHSAAPTPVTPEPATVLQSQQ